MTGKKNRKRNNTNTKTSPRGNATPRNRGAVRDAVNFESLENRQLMAVVNVADFGATPNDGRDDHAAIQRAIDAAASGDTVQFQAGTYNVHSTVHVKSNRTLKGAGNRETKLDYDISANSYGMKVLPNANNVTIENFKFTGGGIALAEGELYKKITIRNNDMTAPATGTYHGNGPAIFQGVNSEDLTIEGNNIHDVQGYAFIGFHFERLRFANNTIKNVQQAAHILAPKNDCYIGGNVVSGLVRMGFEVQRHGGTVARNLLVENNVITGWRRVFNDSFALSIVPDNSENTVVRNNYLQLPGSREGVDFVKPHDPRGGYGIEYGARTGAVYGNVIGGIFANHIVISGGGGKHNTVIQVRDNKMYGTPLWRDWIVTESFGGQGFGYNDVNNVKDPNFNNMPDAPTGTPAPNPQPNPQPNPNPRPQPQPNPQPQPTIAAPSDVEGKAQSGSKIALSWKDNARNENGYRVQRKTTHGGDAWANVANLGAGATSWTDSGLSANWEYDYRVVALGADNATGYSAAVTVRTLRATGGGDDKPTKPVVGKPVAQKGLPNAVTGLQGYALSHDQVRMIWKDTNRNETGYRVERKTTRGEDAWATVAELPAGSKVFVDKRLARNWEYDYRVVSVNARGETVGAAITLKTLKAPQVGSSFVHLNRMKWEKATNGLGAPELNTANGGRESGDGSLMSINGQGYFRGIGVKADSAIRFRLDGKYKTFVSDIGLDDTSRGKGSVRFQVWGDGKLLFDSGTVRGSASARTISVPVQGKQELWLVVNNGGNGNAHDYANWANARLAA